MATRKTTKSATSNKAAGSNNKPKLMTLKLEQILREQDVQSRAKLDASTKDEYAERMKAGVKFPPPDVFHDGKKYWLSEGFHRCPAHEQAGHAEIECRVYKGTKEDAQWHALQANTDHGLRRTNEDKARAVRGVLQHSRGKGLSDRAIADLVAVSPSTVAKYREEVDGTVQIGQSDRRAGKDGRTTETSRIGKSKSQDAKRTSEREQAEEIEEQHQVNVPDRAATPVAATPAFAETKGTKEGAQGDEAADAVDSETEFDLDAFLSEEGTLVSLDDDAVDCLETGLDEMDRYVARLRDAHTRKLRGGHPANSILCKIACAVSEAQEWFEAYKEE